MSPRYMVFIWGHLYVCVCVYVSAHIAHTLSTTPYIVQEFLCPYEIVNNTVLPGTRSDLKAADMHGMRQCRKLPMKLHRAIELLPRILESIWTQSFTVYSVQRAYYHKGCMFQLSKLCDSNNNHPKTQRLKTKCFLSHNSVAWPEFLLLHLVLPGVSECLQSPRNLTGLEHPRWLPYMAASWPLARRSSAKAVNWNTYAWSLHVDWASWLGGKVAKSRTPKKGSVTKSQMKATKLLLTLPWTPHSVISSSFYWSSNSRG